MYLVVYFYKSQPFCTIVQEPSAMSAPLSVCQYRPRNSDVTYSKLNCDQLVVWQACLCIYPYIYDLENCKVFISISFNQLTKWNIFFDSYVCCDVNTINNSSSLKAQGLYKLVKYTIYKCIYLLVKYFLLANCLQVCC